MELNELFSALSKAQLEFEIAVFDKKAQYGPYASFKSVRDASIKALSKYGLTIVQAIEFDGEYYCLNTILAHSSGQHLKSNLRLMIDKNNMQGLGSAITYAKRYAWASLIGIVSDDDDDGNLASLTKPQAAPQPKPIPEPQKPKYVDHTAHYDEKEPAPLPPSQSTFVRQAVTEKQVSRLYAIAKGKSWNIPYANAYCASVYGKKPKDLSREQYDRVCQYFEITQFTTDLELKYSEFLEKREPVMDRLEKAKKQMREEPWPTESDEVPF